MHLDIPSHKWRFTVMDIRWKKNVSPLTPDPPEAWWSLCSLQFPLFKTHENTKKRNSQKKDVMESMCYLLTFIFNQTEGQSHQSLNTLTAPRPSPFRRWVSIRGGGPDLVRAMKSRGFHLAFFLRKVTQKACWCMKSLGFEWYGYFLLKGEKSLDLMNCFSCSEKVTQEGGKLTSSVPYHEDRCLPPKLNPPPLINKAFPLNRSVLQTSCIFVQHLLLASQNGQMDQRCTSPWWPSNRGRSAPLGTWASC